MAKITNDECSGDHAVIVTCEDMTSASGNRLVYRNEEPRPT